MLIHGIAGSMFGVAISLAASGKENDCVNRTDHYLRVDLDNVGVFDKAFAKVISSDFVRFSDISRIIGSPQWIRIVNGSTGARWVHGDQELAEEFLCDGRIRKTYSTNYYIVNVVVKGDIVKECSIYEESYITAEPLRRGDRGRPLISKKYECKYYYDDSRVNPVLP